MLSTLRLNLNKETDIQVKNEVLILTFSVFLFIFRTSIPFFKYPFLVFYSSLAVYLLIRYRDRILSTFSIFIRKNILIIFLIVILVLSFLFSSKIYIVILKDLVNTFVLLSVFYFYYLIIETKKQFALFLKVVIQLTITFALFISIIRIFIFIFLYNTGSTDYNFALISIFFGMVSVFFNLIQVRSLFLKVVYNLFLVVFTINILISSSRRGLFVFFIIVLILIISHIVTLVKRNNILSKLRSISGYYLGSLLLILLIVFLFFVQPVSFKNKSLKCVGVQNVTLTKNKISSIAYRYFSILGKSISFNEFSDKIWSHEFNSLSPESGWGSRIHKVIYPLKGKDVQIVPKDAEGYLMDSTCNAATWKNNSYSYTKFAEPKVKNGDRIISSVYCYVSEDFNGSWVRLRSEGDSYRNRETQYDLHNKGVWQKLVISPDCRDGKVPIYLYFSKFGVTDFSTLKGYVIFAYPQYEVIPNNDSISINDSLLCESVNYYLPYEKKVERYIEKNSLKKGDAQFIYYNASVFNGFHISMILASIQILKDSDPLRNLLQKVFNEDTTYYGYFANLEIPTNNRRGIYGRTDRWKFAWIIFNKEYNWKQKLFGNRYDYLNWYGYYFYNDKTKSDYPHNPFLSVLLYSGIFGLIIYIYLIYRVFVIYLKYKKDYYLLLIFFGITFFFSFFSANNPFSPPIMGFFVMLPFFIDYIHKKDKSS